MKLLCVCAVVAFSLSAREPLGKRIAHNDPSKYHVSPHVHGGAGELRYMGLFDASSLNTNLIFLHRGVLPPKSGIGHHYHNQMEEMFIVFDNEASRGQPARRAVWAGRTRSTIPPTSRPNG